jgi:hypothetical protein
LHQLRRLDSAPLATVVIGGIIDLDFDAGAIEKHFEDDSARW